MRSESVTVQLIRDGNAIGAIIGPDLQAGISGWGATASEALRELADAIERENWPLPELDPRPVRVK
jgi:hypothetical protein